MAARAHTRDSNALAGRALRPGLRFPGTIADGTIRELVARSLAGDEAARASLVDAFYPAVRDTVHRELALDLRRSRTWLAAHFSTGDVVQEVFLAALRDLGGFDGDDASSFKAFIVGIVRHRLLDVLRYHEAKCRDGRRGRGLDGAAPSPASDATSPTAAASRSEEVAAVRRAVQALPPRDRALIEHRFVGNASYAQIARALGMVSEEAARKAVAAAQARLLVQLRHASGRA